MSNKLASMPTLCLLTLSTITVTPGLRRFSQCPCTDTGKVQLFHVMALLPEYNSSSLGHLFLETP